MRVDVFAATGQRTIRALKDLIASRGARGGLSGDIVYVKSAHRQLETSGFYMIRADGRGYEQLLTNGCRTTLWSDELFGPKSKYEILDPQISDEARKIGLHISRICDNSTVPNASLEIGLRAVIRHGSVRLGVDSMLLNPVNACEWAEALVSKAASQPFDHHDDEGEPRLGSASVGGNDVAGSSDGHLALQHLKRCWNRCGLGPRDERAAFSAAF